MSETAETSPNAATSSRVRSIIERVEHLQQVKRDADEGIAEVYKEAAGEGFDVPTLKKLVAKRAKDPAELAEAEALLEMYETACK